MERSDLVQRQRWFVNQRFGMFIHFNSATVQFADKEMKDWEYDHENHDAPRLYPFDPKDWQPDRLDCAQWAQAAKSAGMKFSALTAKHHEGFSLWPTRFTEHCVRNATIQTDVVAAYLDAFRREEIDAGLYFSMLDLHHRIGRKKCTPADKQLILNQLEELLTGYGDIPFLVIDGWNAHWGGPSYEDLPFEEVDALVKQLQPNCLLMNISCESNLNHTDIVFYENAAGQEVEHSFAGPGAGCHILSDTWFWRTTDTAMELKSADWALERIRTANRQNVTFFLNGAPNRQGQLDANVLERFREIGERYRPPANLDALPDNWLYRA
ncbi:alpha-L-fucosidase [Cohnella sp. REN36]|uniref:alpha-L-fucosidase n=1 Tax=Cohnella sp. REN36 TaxID=2887347 RepID=UPI001D142EDC|nr:alpha-L-fucosidase [Cohnella sp. REN36]MCC3371523.1 alpha-L-fucosidase [Cohnella sp. REN36]